MRFIIFALISPAAGLAKENSLDKRFYLSNYELDGSAKLGYRDNSFIRLRRRTSSASRSSSSRPSPEKQRSPSPPKKSAEGQGSASSLEKQRSSSPSKQTPEVQVSAPSPPKQRDPPPPKGLSPESQGSASISKNDHSQSSRSPDRSKSLASQPRLPSQSSQISKQTSSPSIASRRSSFNIEPTRGPKVAALTAKLEKSPERSSQDQSTGPSKKYVVRPSLQDKGNELAKSPGSVTGIRSGTISSARSMSPVRTQSSRTKTSPAIDPLNLGGSPRLVRFLDTNTALDTTPRRPHPTSRPPPLESLIEVTPSESSRTQRSRSSRERPPARSTSPTREITPLRADSPSGSSSARGGTPIVRGGSPRSDDASAPRPRPSSPLQQQDSGQASRQSSMMPTFPQETRLNQIKSQAGKALKYAQDHPRKCVAYTLGVCSGGLFAASIGTGNDPTNSIPKGKSIYATGFGIGGVVVGLTAASVARKGEIIEHASVHGVTDERAREHLSRNVQNVRAGISRAASSASVNLMSQFSSTNNLAPLGNRPPGPLIDAPTATISGSVGVTVPGIADDLAPVPLVRTDISAAILPIGLNTVPSTGGSRQGSAQINPVTPPLPGAGNEAIASNTAAPNTEGATSSSGFIKTCKNAWGNTCKTTESVVSSAAKRMSWRNPEPPNPVRRSLGYID